jgi:hypothetical protein
LWIQITGSDDVLQCAISQPPYAKTWDVGFSARLPVQDKCVNVETAMDIQFTNNWMELN